MMLYLDTLNENEFSTRIETRVGDAALTRAPITRKGNLVRTYTVRTCQVAKRTEPRNLSKDIHPKIAPKVHLQKAPIKKVKGALPGAGRNNQFGPDRDPAVAEQGVAKSHVHGSATCILFQKRTR